MEFRSCSPHVRTLGSTLIPVPHCSPPVYHPGPMVSPSAPGVSVGPGHRGAWVVPPRHRRLPGRAVCPPTGGPGWPRPGDPRSLPTHLHRSGPAGRARPSPHRRSPATQRRVGRGRALPRSRTAWRGHPETRRGFLARSSGGAGVRGSQRPFRGHRMASMHHGVNLGRRHLRWSRLGGGEHGLSWGKPRQQCSRSPWVQFGEHIVEE